MNNAILNYAYQTWLKNKSQQDLGGQDAYALSQKDSYALMNSVSPYDLYLRPDYSSYGLLPETAFNVQNVGNMGVRNATVIYPDDYSKEEVGGIMEHENTHARQIPTSKSGNQGYTTFAGGRGIKEKAAMANENSFWNLLMSVLNN
jgi:hypothetical protein